MHQMTFITLSSNRVFVWFVILWSSIKFKTIFLYNSSSSTIEIGTTVSLAIFWNKEYNIAANCSLDIAKQSDSSE